MGFGYGPDDSPIYRYGTDGYRVGGPRTTSPFSITSQTWVNDWDAANAVLVSGRVDTLPDTIGGADFTQGTAAIRPGYDATASALNDLPAVLLDDGRGAYMAQAGSALLDNGAGATTVYWVGRQMAAGGTFVRWLDANQFVAGSGEAYILLVDSAAGVAQWFVRNGADTAYVSVSSARVVEDGGPCIVRARINAAQNLLGVRVGRGVEQTMAIAGVHSGDTPTVTLGARNDGAQFADYHFARGLRYQGAGDISAADDAQIMDELELLYLPSVETDLTTSVFLLDAWSDHMRDGETVPNFRQNGQLRVASTLSAGAGGLGQDAEVGGPAYIGDGTRHWAGASAEPLGLATALNASDFTAIALVGGSTLSNSRFLANKTAASGFTMGRSGGTAVAQMGIDDGPTLLQMQGGAAWTSGLLALRWEWDTSTGDWELRRNGAVVASGTEAALIGSDLRGDAAIEILNQPGFSREWTSGALAFLGFWPTLVSSDAALETAIETWLTDHYANFGGSV